MVACKATTAQCTAAGCMVACKACTMISIKASTRRWAATVGVILLAAESTAPALVKKSTTSVTILHLATASGAIPMDSIGHMAIVGEAAAIA